MKNTKENLVMALRIIAILLGVTAIIITVRRYGWDLVAIIMLWLTVNNLERRAENFEQEK